MGLGNP